MLHTLADHYHWLKITVLFRIKADSPFQSFVSVVLYTCYCIWYFCNMEMSIIYRDQQILIHFTHQTEVPFFRHFSARQSVPTPLQLLCTSLWPLYNIDTRKINSFIWVYKIWFTVWQFWRCLTEENVSCRVHFSKKYGIVNSSCFPYIQRTALQACIIGNIQDHRAGVQMLMCIMCSFV
jgi:hypothetical protein